MHIGYVFFNHSATAPIGPRPPNYREFIITFSFTHHYR